MSQTSYIAIETSPALHGTIDLVGAKNAVLVIITSLLLTKGKSRLTNVPASDDVLLMIKLMQQLGAEVFFYPHEHILGCGYQHGKQMASKCRCDEKNARINFGDGPTSCAIWQSRYCSARWLQNWYTPY